MSSMTDPPKGDAHKRQLRANFDALAATYDQLRFLLVCASRLLELTPIPVGARVLDVGTGTGAVALGAAQRVGPTGSVVGVDLSPQMLAHARRRLALESTPHVELREGDAEHLSFQDHSFDVVLCASVLPFVPDMLAAAREWRRVLTREGCAGFSSFGPTFLQPLRELWEARLRHHGVTPPELPTHRLPDAGACEALLREAGFTRVEVRAEQLGYYVATAHERWADIVAGLEGKPLLQLTSSERERAEAEHLAEVTATSTADGIWIDVPAIFAFGS